MLLKNSIPYKIQIDGVLGDTWDSWIHGDLDITNEGDAITTIVANVPDQAALRGLVNRLWDLNLSIIYLKRIQTEPEESTKEVKNEY